MTNFFEINKDVLPLKANLAVQHAKSRRAQAEKKEAETELAEKNKEYSEAMKLKQEAMDREKTVQDDAKQCQDKMDAANALIAGLADEKKRWTDDIKKFSEEINRLVGDVIYLTAFLSYAGPFNQEYRLTCQKDWFNEITKFEIPISDGINVIDSLSDMATVGMYISPFSNGNKTTVFFSFHDN